MPEILQTAKIGKQHYHLIYRNELRGTGAASISVGAKRQPHSHQVVFTPPQPEMPPQVDPMTGTMIAPGSPAVPGGWSISPGDDGHVHDFAPYKVAEKKAKDDDATVISEILELRKAAKEIEDPSMKLGAESEEFYSGKQWKKELKDKVEGQDRPALVINKTQSYIKLLSGYQRQNRTDPKFFPTEGGDQITAEILDIVAKNISEQCNYSFEETKIFDDEIIVGRGVFNIYPDYSKTFDGDIIIEKYPWDCVRFGPHEKEDLSDCEYLVKERWFSEAKIKQLHPDSKDEIAGMFTPDDAVETSPHHVQPGNQYNANENVLNIKDAELIDIAKKRIKMLETWRKEYQKKYCLVNLEYDETGDDYPVAENWPKEDVEAIKTIPGFTVIPKESFVMRVTKSAGTVVLEDEYPDIPVQDFMLVPSYSDKRKDSWWGKIEAAKDPQREINKRHSQVVDIVNKCAAYGWFFDNDTFLTPKDKEDFKKNSGTPGFTQECRTGKRPEKVEGVRFPVELVNLITLEGQELQEIMNVTPALLGQQSTETSGTAIMAKQRQGLIGNEYIFDNFSFAKKKVWRLVVGWIQKLYKPERILRIIQNQHAKQAVQLAGKQFVPPGGPMPQPPEGETTLETITAEEILEILKNADLTKYDVSISETKQSPTTRLANFMVWSEMAKTGTMPVPPDMLVDLSDLPNKERVIRSIQAMQAAQQQQEQQKMQMEIGKTMIAHDAGGQQPQGASAPMQ